VTVARWQWRGDSSRRVRTVTRPTITFAANHAAKQSDFNFDLFAVVAVAQVCQRLATAGTDFIVRGHIDLLLALWQVRIVSPFWSGTAWLLSASLLRSGRLLRIIEIIRPIGTRLLFRLFAEPLRLELSNLGPGLIEFILQ
jgi:hypothetical protein